MSERMDNHDTEKGQPGAWANAGITADQLRAMIAAESRHQTAPQRSERSRPGQAPAEHQPSGQPQYYSDPRQQQHSPGQDLPPYAPEVAKSRWPHWSERSRRRLGKTAKITTELLLTGSVGVFGYANDIVGARSFVEQSLGQTQPPTGSLTLDSSIDQVGTKSLSALECDKPDAVSMVITVDGYWPLTPLVSSTPESTSENPTPTPTTRPAVPYMTDENVQKLPVSERADFESKITVDGFLHATLDNLTLTAAICETEKGAITTKGDELTIDRAKLKIVVKDPFGLFGTGKIKPTLQGSKAENDVADTGGMTYPNSANLNLAKNGDPAYDKSVDDLTAAMKTPEQPQLLYETMKQKAVQGIDAVVDGSDNVSYPSEDFKNFQDVASDALIRQLVGKTMQETESTTTWINDFPAIDVTGQISPTTKESIIASDQTGASPLKGLDLTKDFHINSAEIKFGKLNPRKQSSSNSPTPTETTAP